MRILARSICGLVLCVRYHVSYTDGDAEQVSVAQAERLVRQATWTRGGPSGGWGANEDEMMENCAECEKDSNGTSDGDRDSDTPYMTARDYSAGWSDNSGESSEVQSASATCLGLRPE
eukprot:2691103-Pyramimonas_sp.AAC.1